MSAQLTIVGGMNNIKRNVSALPIENGGNVPAPMSQYDQS